MLTCIDHLTMNQASAGDLHKLSHFTLMLYINRIPVDWNQKNIVGHWLLFPFLMTPLLCSCMFSEAFSTKCTCVLIHIHCCLITSQPDLTSWLHFILSSQS